MLERNQTVIGVIAAIVVTIGTIFAVGATGGLFVPGQRIQAEFEDAAGLGSGDFVFLAGVRVGQVTDVWIEQDGVVAEFAVEVDMVPEDSAVAIILQSTLGKRALRLDPGSSSTPLAEGDRITRTSTPIDLPELGDRGAELLGEVDIDALQLLTTALADVTEGQRENVADLLDGVQRVSDVLVTRKDDLRRVIDRAQSVVNTAAESDQEIVTIIDEFSTVLDTLLARQADIDRLLATTASTTDLTADLLEERRTQLDQVLAELHLDLEVLDAHQVDLAHFLGMSGVAFEGFAAIGYGFGEERIDTPAWGNVFATNLGQVGIPALLACGGTLDDIFTALLGPDPACGDGARSGTSTGAPNGTFGSTGTATPTEDFTGFFEVPTIAPEPPLGIVPQRAVRDVVEEVLP